MSAADWIAEQRRIEQAATEGPWRAAVVARYVDDDGCERGKGGIYPAGPMGPPPLFVTPDWVAADAEFIADARTALPKALAALEAVLALHQPVKIYAQADECGCGDEDHTIIESPQGDDLCWDTPTGELCCPECLDEDSGAIDYPCPTVAEIAEALGVEP